MFPTHIENIKHTMLMSRVAAKIDRRLFEIRTNQPAPINPPSFTDEELIARVIKFEREAAVLGECYPSKSFNENEIELRTAVLGISLRNFTFDYYSVVDDKIATKWIMNPRYREIILKEMQ